MSRFSRVMDVLFIEEPVSDAAEKAWLELRPIADNLTVGVPHLLFADGPSDAIASQRRLLEQFCTEHAITDPVLWFYTPMAITFAGGIPAAAVVYDCMDELSAFAYAPAELPGLEAVLLDRADLVFTGGISLFEAKRRRHPRVQAFPSAVDVPHFAAARTALPEPSDQAAIPHPRLGFFGVVDERIDLELLAMVAARRPDRHFVIIGPVVKIDPASLPQSDNIHYLGPRNYGELPAYAAHWEVALMPFALNEATRFISPTKMPEYLAAGKPVVSTAVSDVGRRWAHLDATFIADGPDQFASHIEDALALAGQPGPWLDQIDGELADVSWDRTWDQMWKLIEDVARPRLLAAKAAR